ncbi:hypothetical protein EVG20_g2036 [Dentipellis fragilis]|uniref:Rad60/SUMO-like domain-containing protein n=1 Tax=Dentipellis fragilis TaxID=205917 RepID=A0A4Y9ZAU7_9AGAM|nr:hypothetical protein EVG20_g2036 [Dentipellis fragilis]
MSQTRPRPRPRPRPANRQSSHTEPPASVIPLLDKNDEAHSQSKSAREQELDEEDIFFMKNRNRTAKDWKKIDLLEKEQEILEVPASSDAEDDWNQPSGSSPRKRRKATKAPNGLPEWTRTGSVPVLSSDSDDDLEIVEGSSTGKGKQQGGDRKRGVKRPRSRSRSLTPPPMLTMQQIQNARNVVRQTLQAVQPESPTDSTFDDSTDTITLDELQTIALSRKQSSFTSDESTKGTMLDRGGGPEIVTIKVTWRPHPLDTAARAQVWGFKMKRHDSFNALFDEIADMASVLSDNLILTCGGSRVFASATPHSLKIWAEVEMEASDKTTFEYIRQQKLRGSEPPEHAHGKGRSPSVNSGADSDSDSDVQSVAEEAEDETFKLIVRSATTKDVTLTVRPTTTCGAIVKAFLKRTGLASKYPEGKSRRKSIGGGPRLMVDGEKMNPDSPISEADLEDGDQIEVAGL